MGPAHIESAEPQRASVIRFRAIAVALLFIPINAYWVAMMEAIKYTGHPTTYSLYFNAVLVLAALTGLNALLARLWRAPFTQADLLVVYFMVAMATSVTGHDQAQVLIGVIVWPLYKATPENRWELTFGEHLPRYLIPRDPAALEDFFVGHSSFFEHWRAWVVPLGCWAAFALVLLWMYFCMNAILRRQWMENERLTFPLVALPLEMAQPDLSFYRHRAMWIAFCIPVFINVVNNLHQWFPGVPEVQTRVHRLGMYLSQRPWNTVGGTPMFLFPFAVGIGYLLPLDVLGSSWLFFWYWKLQQVVAAGAGWTTGVPGAPFVREQAYGGYLGLTALSLYAARHHLWRVVRCSFGLDPEYARSRREALPYPVAFWGFLAGFAFLMWFSLQIRMAFWPTLIVFVGFFAITVAVGRLRAEFGSPTHDLHHSYPGEMMPRMLGPGTFSPATLSGFAMFWWFNRAHRSHPMPTQLESLVAAWRVGADLRKMTLATGLAVILGLVAGYIGVIHPHYVLGADSAKTWQLLRHFGNETWSRLATQMTNPVRPEPAGFYGIVFGFACCVSLFLCRVRWTGFTLHPVGYAVSSSWSMDQVWLSLTVAWLCKVLIIRAGGLKLYRRAVPFFLGLILGDFVSGAVFNVIGIVFDLPVYHFLG